MKVSVIIPVRNEELLSKNIIELFENKLKETPYEIVFINDFSTDNTFLTLEKLIENKNQFKLYNNKRKGLGGAITEGINNSTVCLRTNSPIFGGHRFCLTASDLTRLRSAASSYCQQCMI